MKRNLVIVISCCLAGVVFVDASEAKKASLKKIDGKHVFQQNCAGCHEGGGNSIKPGYDFERAL